MSLRLRIDPRHVIAAGLAKQELLVEVFGDRGQFRRVTVAPRTKG